MSEDVRENTYVLPSESAAEMARLIDQDVATTDALGMFPGDVVVHEGDRILDVACGPGGWARRAALEYPQASIVGIDISHTMISYANAYVQAQQLHNIEFHEANVLKPFPFADASFNIANARLMVAFLDDNGWRYVLGEMVRVLAPGGIIILTESDLLANSNSPALEQYMQLIYQAMYVRGFTHNPAKMHLGITPLLELFLQQAGCQQIQQQPYVINLSFGTPGHSALVENMKLALKLFQPFIVKCGIAQQEALDELYDRCFEEVYAESFRNLYYALRVWGKKPE
jgi:ubiquinone/menaquinone biosynthesis C-methylase UbiE